MKYGKEKGLSALSTITKISLTVLSFLSGTLSLSDKKFSNNTTQLFDDNILGTTSRLAAGMGDLHKYEYEQEQEEKEQVQKDAADNYHFNDGGSSNSGSNKNNNDSNDDSAGNNFHWGDGGSSKSSGSNKNYVGMGDLKLLEQFQDDEAEALEELEQNGITIPTNCALNGQSCAAKSCCGNLQCKKFSNITPTCTNRVGGTEIESDDTENTKKTCSSKNEACSSNSCCYPYVCIRTPYGSYCGEKLENGCTPGETKCQKESSKYYVYACDSTGVFQRTKRCDYGCSGNGCTTAQCTPFETKCDGDKVKSCSSDGSGWSSRSCTYGCSNGSCNPDPNKNCTSGERYCNEKNRLMVCNSDGSGWYDRGTCDFIERTISGLEDYFIEAACSPSERYCNEKNRLMVCNSDGSGWYDRGTCDFIEKQTCVGEGGSCGTNLCCDNLSCETTIYGRVCTKKKSSAEIAACTPVCRKEGTYSFLYECDSSGNLKVASRCANGCAGSACARYVCTPYDVKVAEDGSKKRCASDGTSWISEDSVLLGGNPTCSTDESCPEGWYCSGDDVPGSSSRYCTKSENKDEDIDDTACLTNPRGPECLKLKIEDNQLTVEEYNEYQNAWISACVENPNGDECQKYQDAQTVAMVTSGILANLPFMAAGIASPISILSSSYSISNAIKSCQNITSEKARNNCVVSTINAATSVLSVSVGVVGTVNPSNIVNTGIYQAASIVAPYFNGVSGIVTTYSSWEDSSTLEKTLLIGNNILDGIDIANSGIAVANSTNQYYNKKNLKRSILLTEKGQQLLDRQEQLDLGIEIYIANLNKSTSDAHMDVDYVPAAIAYPKNNTIIIDKAFFNESDASDILAVALHEEGHLLGNQITIGNATRKDRVLNEINASEYAIYSLKTEYGYDDSQIPNIISGGISSDKKLLENIIYNEGLADTQEIRISDIIAN